MLLLVGLGNPGAEYAGTRHNIGFMAVDAIAYRHDFSPWRRRFQGLVAEGRLGSEKVLALKPMTFMNLSGLSVGAALRFFHLEAGDLVVCHDDLDLAPGKLRMKRGGGHAGHNGLRSLDAHIGPEYRRCRLGIGRPAGREPVADYVLHPFAKADRDWLETLLAAIAQAAPLFADERDGAFASKVALILNPPAPRTPTIDAGNLPRRPSRPRSGEDDDGI